MIFLVGKIRRTVKIDGIGKVKLHIAFDRIAARPQPVFKGLHRGGFPDAGDALDKDHLRHEMSPSAGPL